MTQAHPHAATWAGSDSVLTTSLLAPQAACNLVLAELSKFLAAVTVDQPCQPLPCCFHTAVPHSAVNVETVARAGYQGNCWTKSRNKQYIVVKGKADSREAAGEDKSTAISAISEIRQHIHIPQAQPGTGQSIEFEASLGSYSGYSLEPGKFNGLSSAISVVQVDMAHEAAVLATQEDQSVSVWKSQREDLAADLDAQENAQEIYKHEKSAQMSGTAKSCLPQKCLSAAGTAAGATRVILPRLIARSPDLRVGLPDSEGQLQLDHGCIKTTITILH